MTQGKKRGSHFIGIFQLQRISPCRKIFLVVVEIPLLSKLGKTVNADRYVVYYLLHEKYFFQKEKL